MNVVERSTAPTANSASALHGVALALLAGGFLAGFFAVAPMLASRTVLAMAVMSPSLALAWWAVANDSRAGGTLAGMIAVAGVLVLASVVSEVSTFAGFAAIVAGGALYGWVWLSRRERREARAAADTPAWQPVAEAAAAVPTAAPPSVLLLHSRMKPQRMPGYRPPATEAPRGPGHERWVQLQSSRTPLRRE